jgi:hypothetical protein
MTFRYYKSDRRFIIDGDTHIAPRGFLGKYGMGLNFDMGSKLWWTGKEETAQAAVKALEELQAKRDYTLTTQATYAKHGDSWAIRVPELRSPGDQVTVVKASGEIKNETLGPLLEDAPGAFIYAIIRSQKKRGGSRGGKCSECGKYSRTLKSCMDSSGCAGECCPRCASMDSYERSFG